MSALSQAGMFLLDTLLGFFSAALLLRFFMQAFRVSFANQIGAFVVQLTNWLVKPLRRVLPGLFGFDLASLLPVLVAQMLLVLATVALRGGLVAMPPETLALVVIWQGVLATLRLTLYLLVGALLVQAILSWVAPYSPLAQPLAQVTRPILGPIRRVVPPVAGIDLSPLLALVIVQLLLFFL
ncbi:YggT family protein [Rhodocyclus tenuis]|uniref:YggT family protein n=1 Tax=Rhodocyclus gracilis TaxID=2929842 RepID=A0ABX0WL23_9RHOO|nr:YggT family protein [Rhodocyclus gracilis]MRD72189.1 YggT family protein [Rhodocyclus gracilis]NJA89295.1 YggT family protein [Rhodocyclus gracilis]